MYLVDVVHLPEVKRAVRRHANVRCIELDVTGFIEHMDGLSPERLELPPPEYFLDDPDVDWVASVNCSPSCRCCLRSGCAGVFRT